MGNRTLMWMTGVAFLTLLLFMAQLHTLCRDASDKPIHSESSQPRAATVVDGLQVVGRIPSRA